MYSSQFSSQLTQIPEVADSRLNPEIFTSQAVQTAEGKRMNASPDSFNDSFNAVVDVPVHEGTNETRSFRIGFVACTGLMNNGLGMMEVRDRKFLTRIMVYKV